MLEPQNRDLKRRTRVASISSNRDLILQTMVPKWDPPSRQRGA
jgi:hypothetical protein